ncbi:hypothetical protein EZ437_03345 [Pedobacter psychroterrae]|uniref:Outer membrane efflux protein n=1 Tax=Pedobacter psychroterrae TaxID=2530453 RepID=A0A4R0NSG0_9SPHI|nr:hypothetical protein EZ437_03345 [Pedobacter psychroterrae]
MSSLFPAMLMAQNIKKLSLSEAIELGLGNSKNLKLSQSKIDEALSRLAQVKDNALPGASAGFLYNHAEITTNTLSIGGSDPIPNGSMALQKTLWPRDILTWMQNTWLSKP